MCENECMCKKEYANELSRLEVLTDLLEFAKQQKAKGSSLTASWADSATVDKWIESIGYLRTALPKCAVEDFDNGRKKNRHRPDCGCHLCRR